jgi:hypothetical protein
MKHLPSQEEEAALMAKEKGSSGGEKDEPYPDSAYASGPDSKSPTTEKKPPRPDSFIAPLPSSNKPNTNESNTKTLYASRVTSHGSNPSQSGSISARSQHGRQPPPIPYSSGVVSNKEFFAADEVGAQSVRSLAPTSKSKGSAIKSVFQRKWNSGSRKIFGQREIWNNAQ